MKFSYAPNNNNFFATNLKLNKEKLNKIINVRVTEATTNSLSGEPV